MKKVLIVEDDYLLSLVSRKCIELMGHTVVDSECNGLAAIEAVKKHQPDVILMDLRLEGDMDGIDTMHEIAKFSKVPVIYLTGNSDEVYRIRAAKTNMIAFCVKPVHYEELELLFSKI
jgi:CheY-like chemotaxis protein